MYSPGIRQRPYRNSGFTLLELLVVIGVIGIIAALFVPAIGNGRRRALVSECTSNLRQLGVASAAYSSDDPRGRLPSFELPIVKMAVQGHTGLSPTYMSFAMTISMEKYGVAPRLWFCPTRNPWDFLNTRFLKDKGRRIGNASDLNESQSIYKSAFVNVDMLWWVPRSLEGSELTYPNPVLQKSSNTNSWPSSMSDATTSTRPIASDRLAGVWNTQSNSITHLSGGHKAGSDIASCNLLFADGHVQLRTRNEFQWQIIQETASGSYVYLY